MSRDVLLRSTDVLPLTCTRGGACCHGNAVWVNPWELARLAVALGEAPAGLRDRLCDAGGTRLVFDGPRDRRGLGACRLYVSGAGCLAHGARPLACRLYPLGRRRQREAEVFFHRGPGFPCLAGCPEVVAGAHISVGEYLEGQDIGAAVAAQDAYSELVSELAEGALVLLIDSGLAATGDRVTVKAWRRLAASGEARVQALRGAWLDRLTAPALAFDPEPTTFARAHHALLQSEAQAAFGALVDAAALSGASATMAAMALHLAEALGADLARLVAGWEATAKAHGARG